VHARAALGERDAASASEHQPGHNPPARDDPACCAAVLVEQDLDERDSHRRHRRRSDDPRHVIQEAHPEAYLVNADQGE